MAGSSPSNKIGALMRVSRLSTIFLVCTLQAMLVMAAQAGSQSDVLMRVGLARYRSGDYNSAEKCFKNLLEKLSVGSASKVSRRYTDGMYYLGEVYAAAGDDDKAASCF